jgi:tetratricopeptide (TPR) repeat protein
MKPKIIFLFLFSILVLSCGKTKNDPEFMTKTTGRYLFNSDEVVEVYFKDNKLYLKWRGANNIKPLAINENTFFVKEMNEKIQFLTNPLDQLQYLVTVPKKESDSIIYKYKKLGENEKIPSEYLRENEFEKALSQYLLIKQNDSLDPAIREKNFNSLGYAEMRSKNFDLAINFFKINAELYPESSNVYDSLGEAYMRKGDTIQAIANFEKSLEIDSANSRAKRYLKRLQKKKE